VLLSNEGKRPVETRAAIGSMQLFKLGPSALGWTRYPRLVIHAVQSLFITAWLLPFAAIGMLFLITAGQGRYSLLLLAIPLYYFSAQSLLHTEYRYVMAIQYSLFVFVAVAFYWFVAILQNSWIVLRQRSITGV
jgi:hypothetical protein